MVLTTGGPLLVDLRVTIGGKPYAEGVESLVDLVLSAGDTDKDGIPTWDELASNPRFVYGPLAGNRGTNERESQQWEQQYDLDRNGWISATEAQTWLGRDAGRSAGSLTLVSSRGLYYEPRRYSRVWTRLDMDQDGTLADDEVNHAAARLQGRDADADGILYLHDLESLRDQLRATEAAPVATVRGRAARRAAWLLDEDEDWQLVAATLTDLYTAGRSLTADSFPGVPQLFGALDGDASGWLSNAELEGLHRLPAHAEVIVEFSADASDDATSAISFRQPSASTIDVVAATPVRLALRMGEATVVFSLYDSFSSKDYQALANERLAVLDQDGSGYVDADELTAENPDATEELVALDADEDGMVVVNEIADYLRLEDAVARNRVRVSVHDQADALFEHLDVDKDGRLGEREIAEAPSRLSHLDANGDGRVTADEIGGQMNVMFMRGVQNAQASDSSYLPIATESRAPEPNAPAWFLRGDFNGDGDISRREFLGTREQFEQLDADGDGFIRAAESRVGGAEE